MSLKLAMLGTGTFALPTFRALLASKHSVQLLVTQPDKTGRGHHRHVNPLKELALEHGVAVFQPENIKTDESLARLREFDIDLYVTAAYGQILSAELLAIPRLGAINLHGSLLPKYRGAAPVQYAVWNDEPETGVTVFQIEPKLDAGPMLGVVKTPVGEQETSGELHDRLAELSAPLAVEVVDKISDGTTEPLVQDASAVTRAPKLKKEDGLIDWSRTARLVRAQVRAVQPWPKPLTYWHRAGCEPTPLMVTRVELAESAADMPPGTVVAIDRDGPVIQCGEDAVRIIRVKPPGKKEISGGEFARGYQMAVGERLSQEVGS